jgi:thioredoxin reductase
MEQHFNETSWARALRERFPRKADEPNLFTFGQHVWDELSRDERRLLNTAMLQAAAGKNLSVAYTPEDTFADVVAIVGSLGYDRDNFPKSARPLLRTVEALAGSMEAKKFDARERRDFHGRWTATGGGAGASRGITTDWSVNQLEGLWGDLDRELLAYAGKPDAPEARKIIRRQKAVVKVLHHRNRAKREGHEVRTRDAPHDVVIVGSGPAGLSAAIYGGTEGLDTVLLDANDDPGGQARMSSRIENVLGFPAGVSGGQYAEMSLEQARRTGADTRFGTRVTGLSYDPKTKMKTLTVNRDGRQTTIRARSVVLAGGVQFRKLNFPGADSKGVVYGSSEELIRQTGADGHAVIVGGANSAGQAAIAAASQVGHVTVLIRGPSIEDKMSKYLVDQLRSAPNVTIRENEEVGAVVPNNDGKVSAIRYKNSGEEEPIEGLAVFVGSAPHTEWTGAEHDDKGYVKADPATLETSIPGVYAAGDVRANSVHRVITAAADGAMAISQVHGFLPQVHDTVAEPTPPRYVEPPAADVATDTPDDLLDVPKSLDRGLADNIVKAAAALPDDEADSWLDQLDALDHLTPFTGGGDADPGEGDQAGVKFDPRERRDNHGRWTRTGGGGSGGGTGGINKPPKMAQLLLGGVRTPLVNEVVGPHADSYEKHTVVDPKTGKRRYTAERKALHKKWIEEVLAGHKPAPPGDQHMVFTAGGPASGKALGLDTPLPTPSGWTTMGDVKVGDFLLDEAGCPVRVEATSPVMLDHDVYDVVFDDGSVVRADGEHLWRTSTRQRRKHAARATRGGRGTTQIGERWYARVQHEGAVRSLGAFATREGAAAAAASARSALGIAEWHGENREAVRTTKQIAETLHASGGRANHAVTNTGALQLPHAVLPLDPYLLGYWLGDGSRGTGNITTADEEVVWRIRAAGYDVRKPKARYTWSVRGIVGTLRELGVLHDKHIPAQYLRASEEQRRALLAGLLDADGYQPPSVGTVYATKDAALCTGAYELVVSLGYKAHVREGRARLYGRDCGPKFTLNFTATDRSPFRLQRKVDRWQAGGGRTAQRYVVDVRPVPSEPVRCVRVDSEAHLYLAGRGMVPTHNSSAEKYMPTFPDMVEIDQDIFKTKIPEYQKLAEAGDKYSAVGHREAADLARAAWGEAQRRGLNTLVQGTGDSGDGQFARRLRAAQASGVHVHVFYVSLPTKIAEERSAIRAKKTGRTTAPKGLRAMHANVSREFANVQKVLRSIDSLDMYDSRNATQDGKVPPDRMAHLDPETHQIVIDDEKFYRQFLAKAKENKGTYIRTPDFI